ncbi:hypothetical protein [Sinobaca sp. H24]|uniref:hypothetical protein n=1 Tax=Sinobaca sp. H24 TaxID=2923376 RepID=UPI00207ACA6D|nr:hypothetical protein [Sinobaca sp. H24]
MTGSDSSHSGSSLTERQKRLKETLGSRSPKKRRIIPALEPMYIRWTLTTMRYT